MAAGTRGLKLSLILTAIDRATAPLNQINNKIRQVTAPFRVAANVAASFSKAAGVERVSSALSDVKTKIGGVADAAETGFRRAAFFIGLAGASVYAFKRQFIDTSSLFENMQISLEGIFGGSADKARQAMAFIKQMTVDTPFEMLEIARSFRTMLGFGLDPMGGTLKAIVDQVAKLGGSGDDLTGISMQIGQAWSKGRLQAQDANILVERGVPVWAMLQRAVERTTGRMMSIGQLRRLSEDGQIGLKGIKLLIEQMGIESQGASARMMKTWTGLISNLSDQWSFFKLRVMEGGAFDALKQKLSALLGKINQWAADGTLDRWASQIGRWLLTAFTWLEERGPVILASLWAGIQQIARAAKFAADLFGGWGRLIGFGIAAYVGGPLVMSVFSLIAAVISLGVALGLTPVGWFLAGVALIAGAALLVQAKWGSIGAWFADLFAGIRQTAGGLLNFIAGVFTADFRRAFDGLKDFLFGWWKGIKTVFDPVLWLYEKAIGAGFAIGDGIKGAASRAMADPDGDGRQVRRSPLFGLLRRQEAPAAQSQAAQSDRLAAFRGGRSAFLPAPGGAQGQPGQPGQPGAPAPGLSALLAATRRILPAPSHAQTGSRLDVAGARGPVAAPLDADSALPAFSPARLASMLNAAGDSRARVVVEFKDAPKGTRVTPDARNTTPLDLSVGYAMADGF